MSYPQAEVVPGKWYPTPNLGYHLVLGGTTSKNGSGTRSNTLRAVGIFIRVLLGTTLFTPSMQGRKTGNYRVNSLATIKCRKVVPGGTRLKVIHRQVSV